MVSSREGECRVYVYVEMETTLIKLVEELLCDLQLGLGLRA